MSTESEPEAPASTDPIEPAPLRLGFARGIAPSKWQQRWNAASPGLPLELVPVDAAFGRERRDPDPPVDMVLERTAPGRAPVGVPSPEGAGDPLDVSDDGSGPPTRRALRLYTEAIALVLPRDHNLVDASGKRDAELDVADLDLVTLLDHPDHAPEWPPAELWADPAYRPTNLSAALQLVSAGLGGILMPLPLARHLVSKREHAIVVLTGERLPGSKVWATWDAERDAADVQQLAGVLRGRTARSSRSGAEGVGGAGSSSKPERKKTAATAKKPAKPKLKPNSRGAQLQAAKEKAEQKKAEKRREKRRKRR